MASVPNGFWKLPLGRWLTSGDGQLSRGLSRKVATMADETTVGLRCLGCSHVARDRREHADHLADADHPDHGEAYIDLPARW